MANTFDPSGGGGGGGSFNDDEDDGSPFSDPSGIDYGGSSTPTVDLGGSPAQDDSTDFEDVVDEPPAPTSGSSSPTDSGSGGSPAQDDSTDFEDVVDDSDMGNRDGTTEDNRLAAQLSLLAGGDGGGQTGFGTTADEVLDSVATSPDRFQSAVEGAREQYQSFREANPMSDVLEDVGGDALTDDEGVVDEVRSRASSMGTTALAVAGVAAVGLGAGVLGGGD
jgi:hypothetical protein